MQDVGELAGVAAEVAVAVWEGGRAIESPRQGPACGHRRRPATVAHDLVLGEPLREQLGLDESED